MLLGGSGYLGMTVATLTTVMVTTIQTSEGSEECILNGGRWGPNVTNGTDVNRHFFQWI